MKRTQIVCVHESRKKDGVDPVFANAFIKEYDPSWLRPFKSSAVRFIPCNDKTLLLDRFPKELKLCVRAGADTTLVVMADVDDDCRDSDELKKKYEKAASDAGLDSKALEQVLFVFPKDQIENWIQYLNTGSTDEKTEGPRVKDMAEVRVAAIKLAKMCKSNEPHDDFPQSLKWSCNNWKRLIERMQ